MQHKNLKTFVKFTFLISNLINLKVHFEDKIITDKITIYRLWKKIMLNYKIFPEKSSVINIKIFQFYVILIF